MSFFLACLLSFNVVIAVAVGVVAVGVAVIVVDVGSLSGTS